MAGVLEKRERRIYLDDTTPLTVTIVTNRMRADHVVSDHAPSRSFIVYSSQRNYITRLSCIKGSSVYFQEYVIKVYRGPNPEEGWEVSYLM